MSAAPLITVLLALLTADLVAQGKPLKKSVFTCAMHPQISMAKGGTCPICGMHLIAAIAPTPKKIQIPPGRLRVYCEKYISEALQKREGTAFVLVDAHVALRGKDWRKRLHGLLDREARHWLSAAAFQVGRLQDRESIPLLKKLLADEKLAISTTPYCPDHIELKAQDTGKCRKCGKPLAATIANLSEQLCIAGALHEMGVEEGLHALEKIAEKPFGSWAFSSMALRDSPRVRKLLAAGAKAKADHRRSAAILAQLRLGLDENLNEALRLLASSELRVRGDVIHGLGNSGMKRAIEPLEKIARGDSLPMLDRISAARALVKLGERKYLGFLMDAFHKTAGGTYDRLDVCVALGEVGDASVLPLLETAIENDAVNRDIMVGAAAKILGREEVKAARAEKK